jgi:hypothetical protein
MKERGIEWNQVRAIAQNHVSSKSLYKPSVPAGSLGLTKWSEVAESKWLMLDILEKHTAFLFKGWGVLHEFF